MITTYNYSPPLPSIEGKIDAFHKKVRQKTKENLGFIRSDFIAACSVCIAAAIIATVLIKDWYHRTQQVMPLKGRVDHLSYSRLWRFFAPIRLSMFRKIGPLLGGIWVISYLRERTLEQEAKEELIGEIMEQIGKDWDRMSLVFKGETNAIESRCIGLDSVKREILAEVRRVFSRTVETPGHY